MRPNGKKWRTVDRIQKLPKRGLRENGRLESKGQIARKQVIE
jgi:hypothetical protein